MGRGICGLYSNTKGSFISIRLEPIFVEKGIGDDLKLAAKWVKELEGYTDVIIHGNSNNSAIMHNGKWQNISQRSLAKMIMKDKNYKGGPIRLLSCSTGANKNGFAQNLANKMGVIVKAPSDVLWIYPNGTMTIGKTQYKNTGKWNTFYPGGKSNEK